MTGQIPSPVYEEVRRSLQKSAPAISINDFSFSGGGCINSGGRLITSEGSFFLKWNDANKFPGMFEAEARGLKLLSAPSVITIPEVVAYGQSGSFQFLLLDYIEQKARKNGYWELLGQQLAALHQTSSPYFGLDHNNYIGSLSQFNEPYPDWVNFFIEKRLQVQLRLAEANGLADVELLKKFEALCKKLPSLLPQEKSSLLHGDLWSGNLIVDKNGDPCLIDPAVYYGNRETDLAMSRLFDGFDSAFYDSYAEAFPLQPAWESRFELYNLYPLLVHVNLFGRSYLGRINVVLGYYV